MATFTITHACGDTVTHKIFGTNANGERQKQAEYLSTRLCSDCYKKAQTEQAQKENQQNGLPELVGTPKQIAWAEKIRAEKLAQLKKEVLDNLDKNHPFYAQVMGKIETVTHNNSASYWIDNRGVSFGLRFVDELCKDL